MNKKKKANKQNLFPNDSLTQFYRMNERNKFNRLRKCKTHIQSGILDGGKNSVDSRKLTHNPFTNADSSLCEMEINIFHFDFTTSNDLIAS